MRLWNWMQWVSLLTTCVVVVVLPFLVIRAANERQNTNNTIRQLVCSFEKGSLQSPHITPVEKQQIMRFYSHALARIGEPPCA